MKTLIVSVLICIVLQFLLFFSFYRIWKKDCKEIGKHKLAVPLHERFLMWLILCPIWAVPFLRLAK